MDSIMTSLANDSCFASVLEHDLCPMWSIFSHLYQLGKFADLVNYAVFIFDVAKFTGACYESSYHLPPLIAGLDGNTIDQNGLLVSHQGDASELSDQRFLALTSIQGGLEARSLTVRCLDSSSETFRHCSGGAVIFGCQRVGQRLLDAPFVSAEPGHIHSKQIVLDKAPIFVLIGLHDGIIRAGCQREASQRFSPLSIQSDLLFHHVSWDS